MHSDRSRPVSFELTHVIWSRHVTRDSHLRFRGILVDTCVSETERFRGD